MAFTGMNSDGTEVVWHGGGEVWPTTRSNIPVGFTTVTKQVRLLINTTGLLQGTGETGGTV